MAAALALARHHPLRVAPQGTGHNAAPMVELRRRFDPATQIQTNHPIDRELVAD